MCMLGHPFLTFKLIVPFSDDFPADEVDDLQALVSGVSQVYIDG